MKDLSRVLTIILKLIRIADRLRARRLRLIPLLLLPFSSLAQQYEDVRTELLYDNITVQLTATEYGILVINDVGNGWVVSKSGKEFLGKVANGTEVIIPSTVTRNMFDDDNGIEYITANRNVFSLHGVGRYDLFEHYDGNTDVSWNSGRFHGVVPHGNASILFYEDNNTSELLSISIPGSHPSYSPPPSNTHLAGRVDTLYISETINLQGSSDTLIIERTTREVETVYNNETVFVVGGEFRDDVQLVLGTDDEVSVGDAFPNPSSTTVTVMFDQKDSGELKVYDMAGSVVHSQALTFGIDRSTFDVSSFNSGMYIYMIVADGRRSQAKRFIVE